MPIPSDWRGKDDRIPESPEYYPLPDMLLPKDVKELVLTKAEFQHKMFEEKVPIGDAYLQWEGYACINRGCLVTPDTLEPKKAKAWLFGLTENERSHAIDVLEHLGGELSEEAAKILRDIYDNKKVDEIYLLSATNYLKGILHRERPDDA